MGRGIGFIPNAYFCAHIDVGCSYEDAKADIRERDRENYLEKLAEFDTLTSKKAFVRNHPFEHSDKEIWEWAGDLQSENADDVFLNVSHFSIHGLNREYFGRHSKKNTYSSKWTAEFNANGILLCSNESINVVGIYSTDDDVAVGVVLKTTLEDVEHDLIYDFEKKWDWYQSRGLDWYKALTKKAEKVLEHRKKKAERMANDVLAELNHLYPVSFRSSAWTMSGKQPVGTFKRKPKPVVVHG